MLDFTPTVGLEVAVLTASSWSRKVFFHKIAAMTKVSITLDNGDKYTMRGNLWGAGDAFRSPTLISKKRGEEIAAHEKKEQARKERVRQIQTLAEKISLQATMGAGVGTLKALHAELGTIINQE